MKAGSVLVALLLFGEGLDPKAWAEEKTSTSPGTVRLPLSEYRTLLRAAGRAGEEARPLEAAFVRSDFDISADGTVATLRATLEVLSLAESIHSVPLPDLGSVFAAEISGSGAHSGNLSVRVPPGGRATLSLRSVPNRKEENGIVTLSWSIPACPSNHFHAVLPKAFSDVSLEGGIASVRTEGSHVQVEGTLESGQDVHLTYAAQAPLVPQEKLVASASVGSERRRSRSGLESVSTCCAGRFRSSPSKPRRTSASSRRLPWETP
jgi:hypothetical protein